MESQHVNGHAWLSPCKAYDHDLRVRIMHMICIYALVFKIVLKAKNYGQQGRNLT